jgi:hypothetical protein
MLSDLKAALISKEAEVTALVKDAINQRKRREREAAEMTTLQRVHRSSVAKAEASGDATAMYVYGRS